MREPLSEKIIISDLPEFKTWTQEFIDSLSQQKSATIVCLSGEVGAGKTTLTQFVAEQLGITETVTSPTFVIQKEYAVADHSWIEKLIHIDAYRLERKEDLEYLGWNDLIIDPKNLILIEWPGVVAGINTPNSINIHIEITDTHARMLAKQQS